MMPALSMADGSAPAFHARRSRHLLGSSTPAAADAEHVEAVVSDERAQQPDVAAADRLPS
jgi:hypothetical protein